MNNVKCKYADNTYVTDIVVINAFVSLSRPLINLASVTKLCRRFTINQLQLQNFNVPVVLNALLL